MSEENKALARRIFEQVWNEGNLDAVDEILDASYVSHGLGVEPLSGSTAFKQFVSAYRHAFPDVHFAVEDQLAEGDKVATRWTAVGTHKGELMGIAPTGKQVTVTGLTIGHYAGGKLVEAWDNWDALGMLQQLDVIPPMGGGGG